MFTSNNMHEAIVNLECLFGENNNQPFTLDINDFEQLFNIACHEIKSSILNEIYHYLRVCGISLSFMPSSGLYGFMRTKDIMQWTRKSTNLQT